jgi:hypothetical protein
MTTPDYLERFGPNSELTEAEIELIAVMRPELDALTLVSGRSRRKKKLDDLGPDARQLSGRLNQFGASAYRQGMVQEALASFALGLRCRLQFSDLRDHDTLSMLRHWAMLGNSTKRLMHSNSSQRFGGKGAGRMPRRLTREMTWQQFCSILATTVAQFPYCAHSSIRRYEQARVMCLIRKS